MAERSGKLLHELMGWPGPVTGRQHEAWLEWTRLELDRPSRGDCYLMQVAAEVRTFMLGFGKDPKPVKLDDFRLRFKTADDAQPKLTPEERAAQSKSVWLGAFGVSGLENLKPGQTVQLSVNPDVRWPAPEKEQRDD